MCHGCIPQPGAYGCCILLHTAPQHPTQSGRKSKIPGKFWATSFGLWTPILTLVTNDLPYLPSNGHSTLLIFCNYYPWKDVSITVCGVFFSGTLSPLLGFFSSCRMSTKRRLWGLEIHFFWFFVCVWYHSCCPSASSPVPAVLVTPSSWFLKVWLWANTVLHAVTSQILVTRLRCWSCLLFYGQWLKTLQWSCRSGKQKQILIFFPPTFSQMENCKDTQWLSVCSCTFPGRREQQRTMISLWVFYQSTSSLSHLIIFRDFFLCCWW